MQALAQVVGLVGLLQPPPGAIPDRTYVGPAEVESHGTTMPRVVDPRPTSTPEPEPEPHPPLEEKAAAPSQPPPVHRPNARIPAIGAVQPWLRYTLFAEYYRENFDTVDSNDGFVALVNRLNLGADTRLDRLTIGTQVRLDTQNIFFLEDRPCGDPPLELCNPIDDDYRLERTTLRLDSRHLGGTVGDFNVSFGRGLGLSIRKIDEIGVDATIKGGRFDLRTRPLRATLIGGFVNRQNSDFATRQLLPDPGYPAKSYFDRPVDGQTVGGGKGCDVAGGLDEEVGNPLWTVCSDVVLGSRFEATLPGRVDVGTHHAFIDFGGESQALVADVDESMHVIGGDVGRTRIGKVWDVYVGAAGLLRNYQHRGTDLPQAVKDDVIDQGYAIYGSNVFAMGTTTMLLELKHYDRWLMSLSKDELLQYTEAPSLEREDQQVPGASNATGGRIRVDHTWRDLGLTLFVNTMEYAFSEQVAFDQFRSEERALATHNYAGVIYRKPKSDFAMQISGGYRWEKYLGDAHCPGMASPGCDPLVRRQFPHAELYFSIPLARGRGLTHSMSLRAEGRYEDYQEMRQFFRGFLQLGYTLNPFFSVSLIQGIDNELAPGPGEPSLDGKRCDDSLDAAQCRPHLWPGAEVRFNIMDASFVRIFAGRQMGGRVCVNGSCRTLPDFEGVRAEVALSF